MSISQWSTTPANNATGVTGVNWAEGQAPSTVNDSARGLMADVAAWAGQASGSIPEYLTGVAGTNTVTATGPAQMASYVAGQRFHFIPANTNSGATTLNITPSGGAALGAKNVFFRGSACTGGELVANVPCLVVYDGTQFNSIGHIRVSQQVTTLGADVTAAAASAWTDVLTLNVGTAGNWYFAAYFSIENTSGAANCNVRLYDGTNTFASLYLGFFTAGLEQSVCIVGDPTITPAAPVKLQISSASTATIVRYNQSGLSKDGQMIAFRLA